MVIIVSCGCAVLKFSICGVSWGGGRDVVSSLSFLWGWGLRKEEEDGVRSVKFQAGSWGDAYHCQVECSVDHYTRQ